jgi:hypothetical protein
MRADSAVIASEAKQSILPRGKCGLLRRVAPRNDVVGAGAHPLSANDASEAVAGSPHEPVLFRAASVGGLLIRARALLLRSNHRICTVGSFLNLFTVFRMMSGMSRPYDCQREAQAAMSMALAATGDDRQKWVRIAIAWQQLARNVADHGRAPSSGQQGLPEPERVAD